MSFRLEADEATPDSVRRVVCEQIERAVQELGDRRRNRHKAIHSARQRCKRIRAVLRLVRKELDGNYRVENRRFRDIARSLSDVRDAEAVIEAADKLHADCKEQHDAGLVRHVRRILVDKRGQVMAAEHGSDTQIVDVLERFREASEQVESWPLSTPGFDLLRPGIQSTYAKARKAFSKAYRAPTNARFHEARKRVKYHWYHVRMVNEVWPEVVRSYRREVKMLSDLLGDDHDLTVMREMLLDSADAFDSARDLDITLSLIERRRSRLQARAHVLGRRVFAEKPANLRKRLGRYWQVWQAETESAAPERSQSELVSRAVA